MGRVFGCCQRQRLLKRHFLTGANVLEMDALIDYSWGMGVFKGVLGWILGDNPGQVELEALPDEPASASGGVPIFLSPRDLRSAVPAEYLRADAPFTSEDIKIKSSEFIDFSPKGTLRIPAFKLALWCPAFVSIPGGMKGNEIVEFPESVLVRSVALADPAGGEVDVAVVDSAVAKRSAFTPLSKGTAGTGDALSDEHGDPFADSDEEQVSLSEEELEETRRALRETVLASRPEGEQMPFSAVLARESKPPVEETRPDASGKQELIAQKETMASSPHRPSADVAVANSRPQMSNVHRIMRAYLQDTNLPKGRDVGRSPEEAQPQGSTPAGIAVTDRKPSPDSEHSVEQIVKTEREIREKSSELLRPVVENGSPKFKRLERALAGYPTVTGVSARIPEGDFSSGDTSGYVSAGDAGDEIRRAFSLTGSMSIRGEAVTCLTIFNETDAVTVLCSRNAQVSIMHGTEGLPLSARRAASRWLADASE